MRCQSRFCTNLQHFLESDRRLEVSQRPIYESQNEKVWLGWLSLLFLKSCRSSRREIKVPPINPQKGAPMLSSRTPEMVMRKVKRAPKRKSSANAEAKQLPSTSKSARPASRLIKEAGRTWLIAVAIGEKSPKTIQRKPVTIAAA